MGNEGLTAPEDRSSLAARVLAGLAEVPDFPEPGVVFKDFTPLLHDAALRADLVEHLRSHHAGRADVVAGIESRGFILGSMLAQALGLPFVPVRKAGKLPRATFREDYALEYGTASLEVHTDAFAPGDRVLLVDDVLATGGTAAAACLLVERCGASVAAVDVVLEIGALRGRERLDGHRVDALVTT